MNTRSDNGLQLAIVLSSGTIGGAERISILLANEFAKRGWSVAILLLKSRGPLLKIIDPRVEIHELGGRRTVKSIRTLAKTLKHLAPRTVIAGMVEVNVATAIAARLAGTGAKVILTEHNQTDRNYDVAWTRTAQLAYRLIRFIYPWADRVVCVSQGVAESLVRFSGLPMREIEVIHNPIVTPDMAEKAAEECPHPWLEHKTVPVILAAGRLVVAKNFELLLRAFAKVRRDRDCRLVILGQGKLQPKLQAMCDTLEIADDVDIAGFTPNPFSHMSRCDVFALSSSWEGFPTVLVEALACGAKVVSTDCPSGPREILCGGKYGKLVPVDDADGFAAALISALDEPLFSGAMNRGQQFTVERAADRYAALIHDLEKRNA